MKDEHSTDRADEQVQFSAILTPHRSLGPNGFVIFMSVITLVSFVAGLIFAMIGAWPVFGFFGLDVLLIYFFFKLNYRAARSYETVDLTESELRITRVTPSGKSRSWQFNPYWVRLFVEHHPAKTVRLILSSHGRELVFGEFLSHDEKLDFAKALQSALHSNRGIEN